MKRNQGNRILTAFLNKVILSILLLSLGLGLTAAGSAPAGADDPELVARGYVTNSLTAQVVLKGDAILGGHGIEVLYPTQGPTDSSGYLPFQYQCTAAGCFQCMEFILWLYDTRLGYPYKWPGEIWSPYELIGVVQIANQLAYKVKTQLLSPENGQYLLYKEYADLSYYANGSPAPPEPGDILIAASGGHAMIVNRVGGDQLEVVEQNNWEIKPDPQPQPLENRQLYFDGVNYTVQGSMGWIHSPRWAALFSQTTAAQAGGDSIQWTRDTGSLIVQLSAEALSQLAAASLGDTPDRITGKLAAAGVLDFTNASYVTCMLRRLAQVLQSESSLNPASGVTALSVKIPYVNGALTITPAGGPQSGVPGAYKGDACTWNG